MLGIGMAEREFWVLGHVSERDLREGLTRALTVGARADALVVAHLAEVEERRLFLKDGFPSLFEYCQKALGLSEGEAFHRINAARVPGGVRAVGSP